MFCILIFIGIRKCIYRFSVRVNKASSHQKNLDVGANLFVGNLDPEIDEKLLYDTFTAFGVILQTPKIMRDPDTGNSKGKIRKFKIIQIHKYICDTTVFDLKIIF